MPDPTDPLVSILPGELATVSGGLTSSSTSDQLNTVLTQIQSSLKDLSCNNNNNGFSSTDMMLLMMIMLNGSGGGGGGYVVGGGGPFGGFGYNRTRIIVNANGGYGGYPPPCGPCCGW